MVNNIPVNGWPQLKDLEAVQPILNRLDKIEAWKRTVKEETFTGEVITIDNALALPARSLKTTINAIQDLHGQSAPYVGGAGKNQLRLTVDNIKAANGGASSWTGNSKTLNNVTITILTDDGDNVEGLNLNGLASSTTYIYIVPSDLGGGFGNLTADTAYIINGGATGATVRAWHYDNINNASSNGADASFTLTSEGKTNGSVDISINNGTTLNNVVVKPMIRLATETDATFAPYSNLCPISGRDSVVVTRSDGDEISDDFTIQLGTTVYGADINWDTGVMTVKTACETFDNTTDWPEPSDRGSFAKQLLSNDAKSHSESSVFEGISNCLAATSGNAIYNGTVGINCNGRWLGFRIAGVTTRAELIAFTTATPIQVEYPLATPTTIQLTPAQLELLKGVNHITLTDGYGTIELKALTGANWS